MTFSGAPFAVLVGLCAGCATLFGGTLALRFRSALGVLLGFSSGAVVGVALFDFLPEAMQLSRPALGPLHLMTAVGIGFGFYLATHRVALALSDGVTDHRRHLGPASLTAHSFLDGLGIGLAFQVSSAAGAIVAVAVLAHDLLDGANTVTLSLARGGKTSTARRWLAADAAAPLVGIGVAGFATIPPGGLALLLAAFAGGFLYMGASELLPLSHDRRPRLSTLGATALGLLSIYIIATLAT